jgi:transposase
MFSSPFLPLPAGLQIATTSMREDLLQVQVVSTNVRSCCPLCFCPAERCHSQYARVVADLPCAGFRVQLILHVRRFFCDHPTCIRKIFTERLPAFVLPWARLTVRLCEALQSLGVATNGELGARLAARLAIQTSPTTIIRRIVALPAEPVGQVSELGIDDFSFRRGRKFGTILIDIQRHKVIDVLPDRKAETAAAWMATHPEIVLVSRDRGGDYASAAASGAPQAIQCADRFHLLKNLGEALEGVLSRHLAAHRIRLTQEAEARPLEAAQSRQPPKLSLKEVQQSQAKREERIAQYQQVVTLQKLGLSQTAIANRVGIGHATVSRWSAHDMFPEQQPRPRKIGLEPHLPFLYERWDAGCHNIAQLYRELVARGYTHSYRSVYKPLVRLLPEGRKNPQTPDLLPHPLVLARHAVFLFLRRPTEEVSFEDQETLALLRSLHAEVDQAYELVQQFAHMLRTRTGEQIDTWLEHVRTSQIREFQGFVLSIERDKAAVVAGLTLPQSNGIVEGNINKLKLIKRMMYGRAAFPLLRQRVLHTL